MSVNVWLPCWNTKLLYFSGFHCQFIQGRWRELIIQNRPVCSTLFLLNVFTALKGTHLYIFININELPSNVRIYEGRPSDKTSTLKCFEIIRRKQNSVDVWPRGYKTFFLFSSAEHKILIALQYRNTLNTWIFIVKLSELAIYPANNC